MIYALELALIPASFIARGVLWLIEIAQARH